jgi:ParB family chromosome partitioning protein
MARRDQAADDLAALLSQFEQQREVTHQDMGVTLQQREPTLTQRISLENLTPDPDQPRRSFPEEELRLLSESLAQHGQLQPILVRPARGPGLRGKYEIVAGERRFRAAKLAGLTELECKVENYALNTAVVVQLVENLHREDLSDMDKAYGLQRLRTITEKTWEEVAELVRLSPSYVKKLAGLIKLEEPVQALIAEGKLTSSQGEALRRYPGQLQVEKAQLAVDRGLTAEAIRQDAQRELPPARRGRQRLAAGPATKPDWFAELELGVPRPLRPVPAPESPQEEAPTPESPEAVAAVPEAPEVLEIQEAPAPSPTAWVPTPPRRELEPDLKLWAALGGTEAEGLRVEAREFAEAFRPDPEDLPPDPKPRPLAQIRADRPDLPPRGDLSLQLEQLREYCRFVNNWVQDPRIKGRTYHVDSVAAALTELKDLQETLRRLRKGNL